jgi:hypothetical protein
MAGSGSGGSGDMAVGGGGGAGGGGGSSGPLDMASLLDCLGFGNCFYNCLATQPFGPQQNPVTVCTATCSPLTKPASVAKWRDADLCGAQFCEGAGGTIPAACVDNNGTLADAPGQSGTCAPCINNATGSILGDYSGVVPKPPTGMCPSPGNSQCNGGSYCATKFSQCLNDQ